VFAKDKEFACLINWHNKLFMYVVVCTMYEELPVFSVGATIGSRFFDTIAHFCTIVESNYPKCV
jgi:hypothetical protein